MGQDLPPDWEQQVARAYAAFDVDELGFLSKFPHLDTDFLRRKAQDQLRDQFGRWRDMRARINKPEREDDGIDPFNVPNTRAANRAKRARIAASKKELEPYDKRDAENWFESPGDESVADLREHIARRDRERARVRNAHDEWELNGRKGPEPPDSNPWLYTYDKYEESLSWGPLYEGTPEERLAQAEILEANQETMRKRREASTEQTRWDYRHRGRPISNYTILDDAGYTQPPTVLPKEEFEAVEGYDFGWEDPLTGTKNILHRGKAGSGKPADQIMAAVQKAPADEHFIGSGVYGNGLYFGGINEAFQYAGAEYPLGAAKEAAESGVLPLGPEGAVIRAKLAAGAKVVTWRELQRLVDEEGTRIRQEHPDSPEDIGKALTEAGLNAGQPIDLFAAKQGIDAFINILKEEELNINVINRAKLILEEVGLTYTPGQKPPRPVQPPLPQGFVPLKKRREGAPLGSIASRSDDLV